MGISAFDVDHGDDAIAKGLISTVGRFGAKMIRAGKANQGAGRVISNSGGKLLGGFGQAAGKVQQGVGRGLLGAARATSNPGFKRAAIGTGVGVGAAGAGVAAFKPNKPSY